jgi:hypothetical protein
VVWSGRSDLPGPLAHGYLAKSGVVTLTANGRANHAGGGSPAVLAAVVAEAATYPATHFHDGSAGAVDGNAHFYGLEISNLGNGKDPYPAAQYDAAVRWAAAICRFHRWSAHSVIGHKEWSDWKSDPSFSMTKFRADVAARLAGPASATPTEDDMPLTQADATLVANTLLALQKDDPTDDKGKTKPLGNIIWDAGMNAFQANNAVQQIKKDVAALKVGGVDMDALAAKVADLLAERLKG